MQMTIVFTLSNVASYMLLELVEVVYQFREHYQEWVLQLLDNDRKDNTSGSLLPARVYRGTPGRPPYQVP